MTANATHASTALPVLFIGHGTPMHALQSNAYTDSWKQLIGGLRKPSAILCISAHWLTEGSALSSAPRPDTLHDFGGFPAALYACQYPCPGAPELAARIREQVTATEIQLDRQRGLDHGCWVPLQHLYPQADIPCLQLSIDITQPASYHYQLARQMQFLRDENVLIVASGNIVHNIARWLRDPHGDFGWARRFDERIWQALLEADHDTLIQVERLPDAATAVPHPDHYLPLIYTIGLQRHDDELASSALGQDSLEACCMRSFSLTPRASHIDSSTS